MLTIRTAQLDILPGNIRANWALIEKDRTRQRGGI